MFFEIKGDLSEEVIAITGAGGGIGTAVVELYHGLGTKIIAIDKDKNKLDALSKYKEVTLLNCDLADDIQTKCLFKDIGRFSINHLICIAGGALEEEWSKENNDLLVDQDITRKTFSANYFSTYNALFYCLPGLQLAARFNGDASVVLTGSINFKIDYRLPAYTSAKGALVGLMRGLIWDFGQSHIRLNILEPGSVITPLTSKEPKDHEGLLKRMPLGKFTTPEDCARAYFALTHIARGINGQEIVLDGGQSVVKYF